MEGINHGQLDKMICQLFFDSDVLIDPAEKAFRDSIHSSYPEETVIQEPSYVVPDVPKLQNYQYSSGDGRWRINLTQSFVALTSKGPFDWADFIARLNRIVRIVGDSFGIRRFSRMGLRYIFAIRRSGLKDGLEGSTWADLIDERLLGPAQMFKGDVVSQSSVADMVLGDDRVRLSTGLIVFDDQSSPETGFLIDIDAYREGIVFAADTGDMADALESCCKRVFIRSTTEALRRGLRRWRSTIHVATASPWATVCLHQGNPPTVSRYSPAPITRCFLMMSSGARLTGFPMREYVQGPSEH